ERQGFGVVTFLKVRSANAKESSRSVWIVRVEGQQRLPVFTSFGKSAIRHVDARPAHMLGGRQTCQLAVAVAGTPITLAHGCQTAVAGSLRRCRTAGFGQEC